jgi:GTP-binding protein HflX
MRSLCCIKESFRLFDREKGGERALLAYISLADEGDSLNEFKELVTSSGVKIEALVISMSQKPQPKYYLGSGKAEELGEKVAEHSADVVIVSCDLSPSQERNLEALIKCRVLSRSGLILAIFAQRARTFEGKLQVELAQLQHIQTRLVRGWTHLERQKGGIGLRGPGETQLETDRRLLRHRITVIEERLKKVRSQREENRRARKKSGLSTVSLVGYTNAGKSTLFNTLVGETTFVEDKQFATLDPLMRKVSLAGSKEIILADTVGFIRNLPHDLIEAFKATLEETKNACLLLHVVDISSKNFRAQMAVVNQVLTDIGAETVPMIIVFNKIDKLPGTHAESEVKGNIPRVWVSAETREGKALLCETISTQLFGELKEYVVTLSAKDARLRARLYDMEAVLKEEVDEEGNSKLTVNLTVEDYATLMGIENKGGETF